MSESSPQGIPEDRPDIHAHKVPMPEPLHESDFGEPIATIEDKEGKPHHVFRFEENTPLPLNIAQWLRYQTFDDPTIKTMAADDIYKFENPEVTSEHFLHDRRGRRLFVVTTPLDADTGSVELSGIVWLHPLVGDERDTDIVEACEQFATTPTQEYIKPENDGEAVLTDIPAPVHLAPRNVATLGIRVYKDNREQGLAVPLLSAALQDFYLAHPEHTGIAVRVSRNDSNAVGTFESARGKYGPFRSIGNVYSVDYLLHERPSDEDLRSALDEPTAI